MSLVDVAGVCAGKRTTLFFPRSSPNPAHAARRTARRVERREYIVTGAELILGVDTTLGEDEGSQPQAGGVCCMCLLCFFRIHLYRQKRFFRGLHWLREVFFVFVFVCFSTRVEQLKLVYAQSACVHKHWCAENVHQWTLFVSDV